MQTLCFIFMANEFLWEFSVPEVSAVTFVHRQDVGVGSYEMASDFSPKGSKQTTVYHGKHFITIRT